MGDTLAINQSDDVHAQIAALLDALRRLQAGYVKDPEQPADTLFMEQIAAKNHEIAKKLKQSFQVEFVDTPLTDVAKFLTEQLGVSVVIDRLSLQDDGIDPNVAVTFKARATADRLLLHMLEPLGLTYLVDDEVIQITTPTQAEARLTTRVYPVYDLIDDTKREVWDSSQLEELRDALTTVVATDSWDSVGGPGAVAGWTRTPALIIGQTIEVHDRIERFLADLRAARQSPANTDPLPISAIKEDSVANRLRTYNLPRDQEGKLHHHAEQVAAVLRRELLEQFGQQAEGISVEPVGDELWDGIVRYSRVPPTDESTFTFDTGGGT
ncbi:MAG: hypothetical protein KDA47_21155, partial [Planctomycetales bacterium]|nr:hypothetical protein [Planctomycetales bacterium]